MKQIKYPKKVKERPTWKLPTFSGRGLFLVLNEVRSIQS